MRAGVRGEISLQPDLSALSLTCDVDWTLSRTLYHERDALGRCAHHARGGRGAWREAWRAAQAAGSRAQTEPQEAALLLLDTCTYCLSKARLSRVEQQGTDRAAGSSAQRCFYLYILFVKGAGLSRELFFDVYSITASSFLLL